MTFHKDKNILCIATKQDTAKNMVTKVKFMYENLPSWLKIDAPENNKLTLRLVMDHKLKQHQHQVMQVDQKQYLYY